MIYKTTIVALLLLLYTGCSSIQTSQDYDPATDFQSMQTVSWDLARQPQTGDQRIDNPFRDARIRDAIQRQLEAKGFVFTPDQATDVRVRYQYTLRQRIDASGTSGGIGFGIGSYGRRGGIAIGTGSDFRQVDEGTLVIDLISGPTDKLLWRGSGSQRFQEYDDPNEATTDINTLVEVILNQFPPAD